MPSVIEFKKTGVGGASITPNGTEYTDTYLMQTDVPVHGPKLLLVYRDLPKMFQRHPEDNRAFVQSIDPDRVNPRLWEVSVGYSSNLEDDEKPENPLARKIEIEYDANQTTRFTIFDIHDNPMLNTAGTPYGAQEINATNWVISVQKNVSKIPKWILNYDNNPINSDTVKIESLTFPKKTLQLHGLRIPKRTKENDVWFYPLTFKMLYREATWELALLNEGFESLETVPAQIGIAHLQLDVVLPVYIGGEKPTQPVLLDKNGRQFLHENGRVRVPELNEIVTNRFDVYKELPFSVLPLK